MYLGMECFCSGTTLSPTDMKIVVGIADGNILVAISRSAAAYQSARHLGQTGVPGSTLGLGTGQRVRC